MTRLLTHRGPARVLRGTFTTKASKIERPIRSLAAIVRAVEVGHRVWVDLRLLDDPRGSNTAGFYVAGTRRLDDGRVELVNARGHFFTVIE